MNEGEWLKSADPDAMFRSLMMRLRSKAYAKGRGVGQALRLFACGCCRRVWDWLEDDSKKAIETLENFVASPNRKTLLAARRLATSGKHRPSNDWYQISTGERQVSQAEACRAYARCYAALAVLEAAAIKPTGVGETAIWAARAVACVKGEKAKEKVDLAHVSPNPREQACQADLLREKSGEVKPLKMMLNSGTGTGRDTGTEREVCRPARTVLQFSDSYEQKRARDCSLAPLSPVPASSRQSHFGSQLGSHEE